MKFIVDYKLFEQGTPDPNLVISPQPEAQKPIPSWINFYTKSRKGTGVTSKGVSLVLKPEDKNTAWKILQSLWKLHNCGHNNLRELQTWLWEQMEARGLVKELEDTFGKVKGRGVTKKGLLEKIRLRIKKSIDTLGDKGKWEWDKACIKISDKYSGPVFRYNGAGLFWPILSDNHPSDSYKNFSKLFLEFWSKGTCPKNWKDSYDVFVNDGLQGSDKSWYEKFRELIPDIETYGKTESEWLNLYAQMWGFVPKGKNLYKYYTTLPDKIEDVSISKDRFVDNLFGQMTLWALTKIFEQDKAKIDLELKEKERLAKEAAEMQKRIEEEQARLKAEAQAKAAKQLPAPEESAPSEIITKPKWYQFGKKARQRRMMDRSMGTDRGTTRTIM